MTPAIGSKKHLSATRRVYRALKKLKSVLNEAHMRGALFDEPLASKREISKLENREIKLQRRNKKLVHGSIDVRDEIQEQLRRHD